MAGAAVSPGSETGTLTVQRAQQAGRRLSVPGEITPLRVHIASLLLGVAFLASVDRNLWFTADDWDFLLLRGLHHPVYSIWYPHNEHWSTLPILVYRAVVSMNGLHSYVPTLAVLLIAHLGICHLLWRISLNARVDPWVATVLTSIFVVLGAGAQNLTWDFQMGFVGSVLFGLLAIQADRLKRAPTTRLVLTWVLLVCSLMCSGIGITMTVACTADRALRRGLRRAALTAVVPAVVYLVWYDRVGKAGLSGDHVTITSLLAIPTYFWTGLSSALGTTFGLAVAGPVLLLILVGWSVRNAYRGQTGQGTAMALAGATVFLFIFIGLVRTDLGAQEATSSRYAYIAIALLLPMIGLALTDLVTERAKGGRPVVYGLLVVVLVANLGSLRTAALAQAAADTQQKVEVIAAAHVFNDGDRILGGGLLRIPYGTGPALYGGLLLRAERAGQLPHMHLTASEIVAAQSRIDISLTPKRLFSRSLVGLPVTGRRPCLSSPLIPVAVPKGGGSLVLASAKELNLGITLHGGDATAPRITLPFPQGKWAVNISAGGTTALLQASAEPGFRYCPMATSA